MASPQAIFLYSLAAYVLFKILRYGRREDGLPPGPPTTPVLGNLLQMPRSSVHVGLSHMSQKWGDIMSLKLASGNMIILSSATAVKEVLDNTGWASSSRPHMYLATLATNDCHASLAPDSPRLREMRHLMNKFLSKSAAAEQLPIQDAEIFQLIYEMMTQPKNFYASARRFSHSIAKTTIFGKRAPFFDSEDVTEFYAGFDSIAHNMSPGIHPPIDLVPILKYLPDSLAPWNAIMRGIRKKRDAFHFSLYDETFARAQNSHKGAESFLEGIINLPDSDKQHLTKEFISHSSLALLDGGSDTTGTFVLTLILCLASYPDLQKRAQVEMDNVVNGRMPILEDLDKLPFVDALTKEILRFRPILPLALPHHIKEDIIYKGYVVPKDSMVMLNLWAIFHDPKVFDKPEVFNPDRFLTSKYGTLPGLDTDFRDTLIFGAGRRKCPGIHVAKLTLALVTMRIIWAFNISEAIDPNTKQRIPLSLDMAYFHDDQVVMPRPFKCVIEPRSKERADIIKKAFVDSTDLFTAYEGDLTASEQERLKELREKL